MFQGAEPASNLARCEKVKADFEGTGFRAAESWERKTADPDTVVGRAAAVPVAYTAGSAQAVRGARGRPTNRGIS